MKKHYDVLVVGGGIIGHSVAYSVSKRGMSVLVIEKGEINRKASSAAAGMLAAQAEVTEAGPLFDLARESRNMFSSLSEDLKEQTGNDIDLIEKGMLTIALTEEKVHSLRSTIAFQQAAGEKASWLRGEDLLSVEPNLSKTVLGAMYAPDDGQVSAFKLATSFARAATLLGARILEYTDVTGILIENDRVQGVKTVQGDFFGDHVVVTGGAWTKQILEQTNVDLPIYPVKGECLSVRTNERLITKTIFSDDCYIVPKNEGRLLIGATMIPGTFDEKVSVAGISQLLNKAINLLPSLKDAEWEKAWSGIRPQTGDGLPYIGEHPSVKGLHVASGHYRNGILLSPITGEIIADLIEGNELTSARLAFSLNDKRRREQFSEASY
jgi:glycine oxidase